MDLKFEKRADYYSGAEDLPSETRLIKGKAKNQKAKGKNQKAKMKITCLRDLR